VDNKSQKITTTVSSAIIAIVAALALLGIVAITVITIPQQQEAEALGCLNYKGNGINVTSIIVFSRGHCLGP
jgi:cell division protein FtsN